MERRSLCFDAEYAAASLSDGHPSAGLAVYHCAAEVIDEIICGTGIFRRNLLDGSGWGVDAEDGR